MAGMREQVAAVDTESHEILVSVSTPVVDVSVEHPTVVVEVVGAPGPPGPAGSGSTVQDEGVSLPVQTKLNFVGAGVTATNDAANSATVVTVPGASGGHAIQDEGTNLAARAKLNFVGEAVTVTDDAANDSTVVTVAGGGGGGGLIHYSQTPPASPVTGDVWVERTP